MKKFVSTLTLAALSIVSLTWGSEITSTCQASDNAAPQTVQANSPYADHLTACHPVQTEGYKTCHSCGGNGICRTCNGRGWFYGMGSDARLDCPNCNNGVCGICNGSGQVFSPCY